MQGEPSLQEQQMQQQRRDDRGDERTPVSISSESRWRPLTAVSTALAARAQAATFILCVSGSPYLHNSGEHQLSGVVTLTNLLGSHATEVPGAQKLLSYRQTALAGQALWVSERALAQRGESSTAWLCETLRLAHATTVVNPSTQSYSALVAVVVAAEARRQLLFRIERANAVKCPAEVR